MPAAPALPVYSIVIPVMNEAGNILPLTAAITATMRSVAAYEVIFVDDGSRDTTVAEILQARARNPAVRLLRLAENRGKSFALRAGIEATHGAWIVTIDGDGQNPPSEIVKLIDAVPDLTTQHLIVAVRERRQDTKARLYASRLANKIRRAILDDDSPDSGCGLKLFPRTAYLRLPYFENMHRYFPNLFKLYGINSIYVPVAHAPRTVGQSKYTNWGRALAGLYDLIGMRWLMHRTRLTRAWEE